MEPSPLTELWPRGRSLGKSDVFVWNSFRSGPGSASIVQGWGRTSTKVPAVLGHGQVGLKTGILLAEPLGRGSSWDKPFREYHFQTPPGIPSCLVICRLTGRQAAVGPSQPKTVQLVVRAGDLRAVSRGGVLPQ